MKRHQEITILVPYRFHWRMFTLSIHFVIPQSWILHYGHGVAYGDMHIECECHKVWFQNRTDLGLNCLPWGYQQTTQSHLCNYYNGLHVRL